MCIVQDINSKMIWPWHSPYHLQEFTSTGSANTETSKVAGSLETKYKWAEHGLTFTEKWNTDNTLGTEITLEDQVGDWL